MATTIGSAATVLICRTADGERPFGYVANGWGGQELIVLPSSGLVIVRMREFGQDETMETIMRNSFTDELVWTAAHLLD